MNEAGSWEQGEARWFSATLRFIFVTPASGKILVRETVFLVKAGDFPEAFDRFLRIGKRMEERFINFNKEDVNIRFSEIITLDIIASVDLDGAEILSNLIDQADPNITLDTPLHPERSDPTQSI